MKIKYNFTNDIRTDESMNLNEISEASLRYDLFEGDIFFYSDKVTDVLIFDGVTIYDFIVNFKKTLTHLENNSYSEFDFTESDLIVSFKKKKDMIEIFSELTDLGMKVDFEEFKKEGIKFIRSFCKDLVRFYPSINTYQFIKEKFDLRREDLS